MGSLESSLLWHGLLVFGVCFDVLRHKDGEIEGISVLLKGTS